MRTIIAACIIALGLLGGGCAIALAGSPQLVTICQAQPCANAQEFTVADSSNAPIFSVGEYGGAGVFGDNLSVYPPGSVYTPAVVESYESPAAYVRDHPGSPAGCSQRGVWLAPGGIWACRSGTWVREVRL